MTQEKGERRKLVQERIKRIVRSSEQADSVVVKIIIGTLLGMIVLLASYYLLN
ncbi:MAG: hypothetical protein KF803_01330 [Cyclobacteriaceae bacterium]|nr:hypothetical protein [Cyclobacteriaceae bacterium]